MKLTSRDIEKMLTDDDETLSGKENKKASFARNKKLDPDDIHTEAFKKTARSIQESMVASPRPKFR